ncbi:zf-HC2 domain-containing protein [Corynebacterium lubricantis]|uniref:zf-HC2 domain-containing protein n=1 Tax=Corynebacterium lubricantis TaxID=541095 RepID=UPI0003615E27|nr:zf-HC2 domain-containing protein [Corynebacterium lubricantis]
MLDHKDVQQALSARLDGEPTGYDDAVIDAHLATCEECQEYWDKAVSLSRTLSFVDVDGGMAPPPNLTESIVAGVEPEWRKFARRRIIGVSIGRVALVIAAILHVIWAVQLVMESGSLVVTGPVGPGAEVSADPEFAALLVQAAAVRFAFALAFAFSAWRPSNIPGILLITGSVFAFTLGFAVRDWILVGSTENWGEMWTLLFACIALIWTWIADRGVELRQTWKTLNAEPA